MIIALLPVVYLVSKFIVLRILPNKYFYDSINIIQMLQDKIYYAMRDKSYQFAASFFSKLNIFNLDNIDEWHIILGIVFIVVFAFLILGTREPNSKESVYLLATFGLLEIYVFTISKELCQFCIYCLIVIAYKYLLHGRRSLVIFTALVFFIEGILFRPYYALIAILYIALTMLFRVLESGIENDKRRKMLLIIALIITMISIIIIGSFYLAKSYYMQLATVRVSMNGFRIDSADARTMINNLYNPDAIVSSPVTLCINYLINALRMLFPFELLTKGPMYVPFCIYQLATTYFVVRALANALDTGNQELCFFLAIYLAYFSVSVMFEPDFGSWVRHDVSTFPILLHFIVPRSIRCNPINIRKAAWEQ